MRGKGLHIELHLGPNLDQELQNSYSSTTFEGQKATTVKMNRPLINLTEKFNTLSKINRIDVQSTFEVLSKLNIVKRRYSRLSSSPEVYVKVKLEPENWFQGSHEKKSEKDSRNPPVFGTELIL